MVDGLAYIYTDPAGALEGVTKIARDPDVYGEIVWDSANSYIDENLINGSAEDRARFSGYVFTEIVVTVLTLGAGKAGTAGKAADAVGTFGDMGKLGDMALDARRAVGRVLDEIGDAGGDASKWIAKIDDVAPKKGVSIESVGKVGSGADIGYMKNNADPMREILGPGKVSSPDEWNAILKQLEESGVEVKFRDGNMAYAPGLVDGSPGQIVIDPDASLSALKHEYRHFLDSQAEGFPSFGKQMFEDPKSRAIKELRAYMEEIKEADRLGLKDASAQLFENYRQEREWIVNQYILPGGD